jgi:hypothetical protein
MTPKGRRMTTEAVPQVRGPLLRAFSDMSAKDLAMADALLRKIVLSLDKGAKNSRAVG